jgi:hypothetical protein
MSRLPQFVDAETSVLMPRAQTEHGRQPSVWRSPNEKERAIFRRSLYWLPLSHNGPLARDTDASGASRKSLGHLALQIVERTANVCDLTTDPVRVDFAMLW